MGNIPKIIHQTWKNTDIPELYKPLIGTWKENHTDWEYILWTDVMNRDFIENHHPDFLSIYDNFPHNIQRVDAVRYFILYEFGGVFIDMDFECKTNIEPLLQDSECVFGIEPDEHCKQFNKQLIICNAFMACSPRNDFFKSINTELKSFKPGNDNVPTWQEILGSTGPFKLTEIYNQYNHKDNIKLLPADVIYPLSVNERLELLDGENISAEVLRRLEKAYAVHYFLASWW